MCMLCDYVLRGCKIYKGYPVFRQNHAKRLVSFDNYVPINFNFKSLTSSYVDILSLDSAW